MKKMLMVLAVLAMTLPAVAGVVVSGNDDGGLTATISYDASSMSELVRAFALNISVDSGAVITDVNVVNGVYNIYPGSIVIEGNAVTSYGSAVANAIAYPNTDTLGGIDTAGVTVEMGSLEYVPAANDVLVTITVDKACTVTVAENAPRAGIVMEDPTLDAASNLPMTFDIASGVCKGDCNGDGKISPADMAVIISFLSPAYKTTSPPYTCTPVPAGQEVLDVNGDGKISPADMAAIVAFLSPAYKNTSPPYTYVGCMP